MGTPVPLRILLVGLEKGEAFQQLAGMGHTVDHGEGCYGSTQMSLGEMVQDYDLILGPKCWRLLPEHMKFLPLALKEARAYAKATRPKKSPAKKKASHT